MSNGTCTSNSFNSPDSSVPPSVSSSHIPSISSLSSPWIILDPDIRIIFDAFLHALSAVDPSVDLSQIESPVGSLDSPILSLFPHAPDPEDQHGFSRRGPYCSIDTENPSIKFALSTVLVGGSTISRSHLCFDVYCRRISLYEKKRVNGKKKRANPKETYLADEYLYLYLSLTRELVRAWAARPGPKFLFIYGNIASNLADKLFGEGNSISHWNNSQIHRFDINHPEALRRCDFQPNPDFIRKNKELFDVAAAIRDSLPESTTTAGCAQNMAVDESHDMDNDDYFNSDNSITAAAGCAQTMAVDEGHDIEHDNDFDDNDSIMDEDCVDVDYDSTSADNDDDPDFVDDLMHKNPDLLDHDSSRLTFAPGVSKSDTDPTPSLLFDIDYTMIHGYLQMRLPNPTSSHSFQQSSSGQRPEEEDLELSTEEKSMVANAEQKRRKFQPLKKARLTIEQRREVNRRNLRIAQDNMRQFGPSEEHRQKMRENGKRLAANMILNGPSENQRQAMRKNIKKAAAKATANLNKNGPTPAQKKARKRSRGRANQKLRDEGQSAAQRKASVRNFKKASEQTKRNGQSKGQIEGLQKAQQELARKRSLGLIVYNHTEEGRAVHARVSIENAKKRKETGPTAQLLEKFPEKGRERHKIPKNVLRCPSKTGCSEKFDFTVHALYWNPPSVAGTFKELTQHMKDNHEDDDWLKLSGVKRSEWVAKRVLEAMGK